MLLLLSEIRKKLLWTWLLLAAPTLLLLTVQEFNNVFTKAEAEPWIWACFNLLPGFILLLLAAILNLNAGKHIWRPVFRVIWVITAVYLLWVLLTALGLRARPEAQTLIAYFQQAWYRPALFQVLLLGVFGLLFFRRNTVLAPNEKIVGEHAVKVLEQAKQAGNLPRASALEFFTLGKYLEMFAFLKTHFAEKDRQVLNDLALLENQFNENRRQLALGVAEPKAAQREYNRIALALLGVIEKM
ncbi:MAG: hypothetical protein KDD14_10055 [Saprospiraceae bacterium]|nr:hypothetical protein [Saprospiraceae bacterium]